ncbi:Protein-lysine N-methyltransferase efm5 [Friedmanniomyces endolithicus]|uniref:Protein-lysine N-methyltransferase efm5 n=1 Tax=Friedmanniomyces endolithicus TaxID=329885 RepID=A0AAN6J8B1_9PEZI|nr:Protein-lysine N-methyltransferase efm5 [Friedmanniomyces endolithicus]
MAPMTKSLNKVLWWPVESQDAVEREYLDQIDKNAQKFKDLDVKPADIANFTFQYLLSVLRFATHDGAGEAGRVVNSRSGVRRRGKANIFKSFQRSRILATDTSRKISWCSSQGGGEQSKREFVIPSNSCPATKPMLSLMTLATPGREE